MADLRVLQPYISRFRCWRSFLAAYAAKRPIAAKRSITTKRRMSGYVESLQQASLCIHSAYPAAWLNSLFKNFVN